MTAAPARDTGNTRNGERAAVDAMAPRLLLGGLGLPESPRWADGRLFFSDVWCGEVVALDLAGQRETIARVPNRPSGLGWLPDGRLLVVSMLDRQLLVLEADGQLRLAADLRPYAGELANDMLVDRHGRAYVGGFVAGAGSNNTERRDNAPGANLLLVDFSQDSAAPVISVAATDLRIPNGLAISADGATLLVAETAAKRLTAFTIAADGALSARRTWADLELYPDGICLDAGGCAWVASNTPPCFQRVAEGGAVLRRIDTGDIAGFACVLGGTARDTLFLLEAPYPSANTDRAGRIRVLRADVAGAGLP